MSEQTIETRHAVDPERAERIRTATEIAVRLGALFLLVLWCLQIVAPFIGILVWALVIAIATAAPHDRLSEWLGGRRGLAATLLVVGGMMLLIVPAALLSDTLVSGAQQFADDMQDGRLNIPPPPEGIAEWPIIGERVHDFWLLANQSLDKAIATLEPQLTAASLWAVSAAQSAGLAMLQLIASIVIAGILLVRTRQRHEAIERFAGRLAGDQGIELAALANATVQSVVQGIVLVALIQSALASLGFVAVGLPAAGLWAALVLIAAVVQLPVLLVMIPPIAIVFSSSSTVVAGIFAAWCLIVALLDSFLKPIFFGRGAKVPTVVIFVGAIGGMLAMGILGLFVGAVVLALGYEIIRAWVGDMSAATDAQD